jgi:hypothetical protein
MIDKKKFSQEDHGGVSQATHPFGGMLLYTRDPCTDDNNQILS